jgi:hypothetical protein
MWFLHLLPRERDNAGIKLPFQRSTPAYDKFNATVQIQRRSESLYAAYFKFTNVLSTTTLQQHWRQPYRERAPFLCTLDSVTGYIRTNGSVKRIRSRKRNQRFR